MPAASRATDRGRRCGCSRSPRAAPRWTDEESRKNFDGVRRIVVPGSAKSRLLMHPLAEAAGGDFYHSGGKHFGSQNDPEWLTLKAWVMGATLASY